MFFPLTWNSNLRWSSSLHAMVILSTTPRTVSASPTSHRFAPKFYLLTHTSSYFNNAFTRLKTHCVTYCSLHAIQVTNVAMLSVAAYCRNWKRCGLKISGFEMKMGLLFELSVSCPSSVHGPFLWTLVLSTQRVRCTRTRRSSTMKMFSSVYNVWMCWWSAVPCSNQISLLLSLSNSVLYFFLCQDIGFFAH